MAIGKLHCLRALSMSTTGSGMSAWTLEGCAVASLIVCFLPGGTLRRSWLLLMPSCPRIPHPCSLCGRDMVRCHISSAMRSVSFASGQRRRMLPHRRKEDIVATLLSLW